MSLTQEQADARSRGIGGSEAAAVLGISPWRTPVQVYQLKRKEVEPEDLSDNELVRWGELLEEVIGKEWARRQNKVVHRVRETKFHRQHAFMLANIDFRVVGEREGLEVKNASQWTNEKWGELGSDDVPLYYLTQGVHYMSVLDYNAWNYAVLLGGNELLHYRVERDAEIEQRLISVEGDFWSGVEKGKPPAPTKIDDLTRLWKKTHGRVTATPEIRALVERAREIKALVKPLTGDGGELDQIKLAVGSFMGEAGDLFDPDDSTLLQATYRANSETRVDTKAVREGGLKQSILELVAMVDHLRNGKGKPPPATRDPLALAKLEQLTVEQYVDLMVASLLKTGTVRKFLPK